MKNALLKVKSILFILLSIVLTGAFSGCSSAMLKGDESGRSYSLSSGNYDDFLQKHFDRTPFTEGEKNAAAYIADKFDEYGFSSVTTTPFTLQADRFYNSQNVRAIFPSNNAALGNVIIGFDYSNDFSDTDFKKGTGAEGAYRAGGVAAALAIAEYLSVESPSLPFNVVFVAFGAGRSVHSEAGEVVSFGAYAYVNGDGALHPAMSVHERTITKLMINLDALGGGDITYLYAGEKESSGKSYLSNAAASVQGEGLKLLPPSRPSTSLTGPYISGLPYMHIASVGAHAPFMAHSINVASLFGGNAEFSLLNFNPESATHSAIIGTSNETRAVLSEIYPSYRENISYAASVVVDAITNNPQEFFSAFSNTPKANPYLNSAFYLSLTAVAIFVVAFAIAITWTRHIYRKHPPVIFPIFTIKTKPQSVFGEEYDKNDKQTPPKKDPKDPFEGY